MAFIPMFVSSTRCKLFAHLTPHAYLSLSKITRMLQEAEDPYISLKWHKGTQNTQILNTTL